MNAIIFDTETTGKNDPELIEAAWAKISDPVSLQIQDKFSQRYRPSKPIELGAMAIHHIIDSDVAECLDSKTFALPDGVDYLIGHNIDYDWKVIGEPNIKRICTLALSRMLFPELDSHTLSAMVYHFEKEGARDRLVNAHSAYQDVLNCRLVLDYLLYHCKIDKQATWEDIWVISEKARIPTVISFGKHKGTAIKSLPSDYVSWLLKQPELDPYLEKALRAAG